jgi:hypothetical protein
MDAHNRGPAKPRSKWNLTNEAVPTGVPTGVPRVRSNWNLKSEGRLSREANGGTQRGRAYGSANVG